MSSVCQLFFDLPNCKSFNESNPSSFDGSIQVVANNLDPLDSSTIKYNLNSDFIYSTGGSTSGIFSSLGSGNYSVYARVSDSCRAIINVFVDRNFNYGIHYRFETHDLANFNSLEQRMWRFDIEEKDYVGDILELVGSTDNPIILSWQNQGSQDSFDPVISSSIKLNIISETDQKYINLFSFDERQFLGKLYQYNPSIPGYELFWIGYLTPMLYSEPYVLKQNYEVSLTFSDGLANLSTIPFSDSGGNFPEQRISILDAIVFCLKKTDLSIDIRENVNLLFGGMDSGDHGSMLKQAYINPETYLDSSGVAKNCLDVLKGLLSPIARLYQSNAIWNIDLITQFAASDILVRQYDSDGNDANTNQIGDNGNFETDISTWDFIPFTTLPTDRIIISQGNIAHKGSFSCRATASIPNTTPGPPLTQAATFLEVGKKYFLSVWIRNNSNAFSNSGGVFKIICLDDGAVPLSNITKTDIQAFENYVQISSIFQSVVGGLSHFSIGMTGGSLLNTGILDIDQFEISCLSFLPRIEMRRLKFFFEPRVRFIDQSAFLNVIQNYGAIKITYPLSIENNFISESNFEDKDIVNGQLKGWNIDTSLNPSGFHGSFGLEKFDTNKNALFIDFNPTFLSESILVTAKNIPVFTTTPYKLSISFDVYTRPLFENIETKLFYSIKITKNSDGTEFFVQPDNLLNSSDRYLSTSISNLQGNEFCLLNITENLTWKTIKFDIIVNQSDFDGRLDLKFLTNSIPTYELIAISELVSMNTNIDRVRLYNNKIRLLYPSGTTGNTDDFIIFYELEAGTDIDDYPFVVRPSDFSSSNQFVWKSKKIVPYPKQSDGSLANSLLQSILFRNVIIAYHPNEDEDPLSEIVVTETINTKIKPVFDKPIVHGDLPKEGFPTLIIAKNYQNISKSFISDSNSQSITGWSRRGVAESFTYQQLVAKMIRGEYVDPRWKLSGSIDTREIVPSFNNNILEIRTGRVYIFSNLDLNLRLASANIEMIELIKGDAVEDSDPAPVIEPPVETRIHSVIFSSIFN